MASHEGDFLNDAESPALVQWMVKTADQFAPCLPEVLVAVAKGGPWRSAPSSKAFIPYFSGL